MILGARTAPLAIRGITDLPHSAPGMRIGLYGGSFNPVHGGHVLVAEQALRRLRLDALWVLVTPGNPLKDRTKLAPLATRVREARAAMDNKAIRVTGFEAARGFSYSYETVRHLKARLPGRRLVWIMGADNLAHFHRWERWRDIAAMVPMAIYVRPGATPSALASPAARALARYRIEESDAASLATRPPPAWVYLHGLASPLSSSAIRARGKAGGHLALEDADAHIGRT